MRCEDCKSELCLTCNGSGEGLVDGSWCPQCNGAGVRYDMCYHCQECEYRREEAKWEDAKERYYNAKYGRE